MKKLLLPFAVIVAFTLMSFVGNNLHVESYKVDTKLSSLEWYAEKVSGKHNGTIMFSNGEINNEHGNYTGNFEIDMNTIEDKDIASEEYRTKLNNHLKSPDFFDVEKFPKSKFVVKSILPLKEANELGLTHTVKGMLTIKDKTNEISFDAAIKIMENKISCIGSAIVDRSKFDVKYGSKTFFKDIGDKMIYDEFTLKFNVIAVK
jgi:polyisoprenoid-binding protein YceI